MEELYKDMLNQEPPNWLERAVDQHNPRVTVELANTVPVGLLTEWEIYLIGQAKWN